jgi:hypothetical protein
MRYDVSARTRDPDAASPDSPLSYGLGGPELGDEQANMLMGIGIKDEEYNRMLMDILGADVSTFDSMKRQHDVDEEGGDECRGKRSRFEVLT